MNLPPEGGSHTGRDKKIHARPETAEADSRLPDSRSDPAIFSTAYRPWLPVAIDRQWTRLQ